MVRIMIIFHIHIYTDRYIHNGDRHIQVVHEYVYLCRKGKIIYMQVFISHRKPIKVYEKPLTRYF